MHRAHILPADMGVHHLWKKDWFQNRKGCNMATPTVKECDISRAPRRSHCVTVTFSAKVCARILAPSAPNWLTAWRWEWKSCLEFRPQNSWLKSLTKVWKGENSGRWLFFCLLGWSGKSSWFPPPPNEVFGFVTWRADFWLKHNNLYFSSSIPEIRSSHILWPKKCDSGCLRICSPCQFEFQFDLCLGILACTSQGVEYLEVVLCGWILILNTNIIQDSHFFLCPRSEIRVFFVTTGPN